MPRTRPYLYYDHVVSLCDEFLRRIEGKLVIRDNTVLMYKWCPAHGQTRVLVASDAAFWRMGRELYIKPPEMPERFKDEMGWGCPYDCGLCPDHMQHSCLTTPEITDHCNLSCPVCYAASGPHRTERRDLATIERMLEAVVANEGEPDVVQISGGEPTTHPDFFAILDAAKRRPIKHLMLNTNGIRIAAEAGFAERLATYAPGLEVYLQFDSLERDALMTLRGADLRRIREDAVAALDRVGLSTTLVMTVAAGVNDDQIGDVIAWATQHTGVRGVTLQPIQFAGRIDGVEQQTARLTLTDVRRLLLDQCPIFQPEDVIPEPCNPDSLAMGYALRTAGGITPLTRFIGPEVQLAGDRNTIVCEQDPALKDQVFRLFATNHTPEAQAKHLASLLCCLPGIDAPPSVGYDSVFRVLMMAFMDATAFDVRAMKKSCVHIVQPDGRIIPFESFNLLYRDDRHTLLDERRAEVEQLFQMQRSTV